MFPAIWRRSTPWTNQVTSPHVVAITRLLSPIRESPPQSWSFHWGLVPPTRWIPITDFCCVEALIFSWQQTKQTRKPHIHNSALKRTKHENQWFGTCLEPSKAELHCSMSLNPGEVESWWKYWSRAFATSKSKLSGSCRTGWLEVRRPLPPAPILRAPTFATSGRDQNSWRQLTECFLGLGRSLKNFSVSLRTLQQKLSPNVLSTCPTLEKLRANYIENDKSSVKNSGDL